MHTWNTSGSPWLRRGLVLGAVVAAWRWLPAARSSGGSDSSGNAQTLLKQTFASRQARQERRPGHQLHAEPLWVEHASPRRSASASAAPSRAAAPASCPSRTSPSGSRRWAATASSGSSPRAPAGYVTLQGTAYQLPSADFQRLESSFSSVARIQPEQRRPVGPGHQPAQHWLTNPSVVGIETRSAAPTPPTSAPASTSPRCSRTSTRSWARRRAPRAPSSPARIPQATQQKIAAAIKNATVDVWTGKSDKILRKLTLNLNVPVSGRLSTLARGHELGRDRAHAPVLRPQPAPDDRRAHQRAALQPVHHQAAARC